jgi:hypothetical protein
MTQKNSDMSTPNGAKRRRRYLHRCCGRWRRGHGVRGGAKALGSIEVTWAEQAGGFKLGST